MAVGLVDLWWATCHQFKRGFFVPEFTSLLTPNFMAATACFNMFLYPTVLSVLIIILAGYSHTPWQTVRLSLTLASSTASWYICTLLARSGYLIASSIRTKNSFWAFFAWPPWPRIVLRTFTCAPRMQEMKASLTDWFMTARPASNQRLCWGRTSLLDFLQRLDEINQVSFDRFPTFIRLNLLYPGYSNSVLVAPSA